MKNYALLIAILVTSYSFSQEEIADDEPVNLKSINDKKHEFRIDALEAILIPALDVSYEYVLSKYSGFGASISLNLGDDSYDSYHDFAFTPYYRQYFFNRKDYGARGFYAEGLLRYATGEEEDFTIFVNGDEFNTEGDSWSQFGIGFAIGQKWVSRNGFVFDLSAGVGRYLGNSGNAPDFFFRGGLNVGYRF